MSWLVIIILLFAVFLIFIGLNDNDQNVKPEKHKNTYQSKPKKPKKSGHKERYSRLYEFCNQDNIVFLDTETTGLGDSDQIIEIGIVDINGKVLLDSLVKPTVRISPKATKKHGITDKDLKNEPSWPEVYKQFLEVTNDKKILAYNSKYDKKMVRQSCKAHKLTNKRKQWDCVMLAYAEFMGHEKWYKLENAVENCGISINGEKKQQHRAVYDAGMALGVYKFMQRDVNHILRSNK